MRLLFAMLPLLGCSDYSINASVEPTPEVIPDPPLAEPVAIAGPSVRVKRFEETVLDASLSFDPDHEEAVFQHLWWVAEEPEEAVYSLSDFEAPDPVFSSETLGLFEVGLLVVDEDGLESLNPAATQIEVVAWEQLEVRLTWDIPKVDLDLHLVRPGGSYYSETDDCYFGNPLPDWGVAGESSDDPYLDSDSEADGGPETITLQRPEEGVYELFVHYFNERDATYIYATPTLEVWAEGQLIGTQTGPKLYNAGKVWRAGSLDWSSLAWTPTPDVTTHSALGGPPINE
ncbi:MAG: hypothetical protein VXW32_04305 [Myxococcota bacterium]|nr:hypothetical protein [Myxococcota bacterium]